MGTLGFDDGFSKAVTESLLLIFLVKMGGDFDNGDDDSILPSASWLKKVDGEEGTSEVFLIFAGG